MSEAALAKFSSRKFILAMTAVLPSTFLVWFAKISDGVYSAVMLATLGAYLTANVMQKQVEKTAEAKAMQSTHKGL